MDRLENAVWFVYLANRQKRMEPKSSGVNTPILNGRKESFELAWHCRKCKKVFADA